VARQPLPDPTRPAATQLDPRPSLTTPHLGPDAAPDRPLRFFNGFGGFTEEGDEYVISLERDRGSGLRRPPAPWINVVANPRFGFTVSEVGAGCTWSRNSREHRLTPWSNDSTRDPHGEALYLRDEETGAFWSPLPGPAPPRAACEARHGFGYSLFRQTSQGLGQESCVFAARGERVKLVRLRLAERSGRPRRLSLFAYQRLVLGVLPEEAGRFVVTAHDVSADMLFARNRLAGDFADGVTFAAAVVPAGTRAVHCCADREGYIGRNGSPACPAAVARGGALDGRVGAGLDPCFAQQVVLDLAAGGSSECVFLLGEADDEHEARTLVARLRAPGAVERELEAVRSSWREVLSAVRIETPEPALDLMANGWLAYQDLSCRVWGRSAFYQSGGAFGYRDQLQDAAALLYLRPDLTRAQILLHAAHQFVEGDVLHWWHPPRARGLRTRFADDLLWLPWAAAGYVRATGDWSLLEERARYLAARPLAPGEDEAFLEPADSGLEADVYDHCCRALDRSLVVGERGLPLFGTGDWNDGMNRVGREGKGESVWMGFFLVHVLGEFLPLCERRRDHARARRYRAHAERLTRALNEAAWDGDWYRRGYYDDGTPLGSRASDECQIDALAQAWAVISGVAPPERAGQAMDAVERHLVQEKDGLIRLLTPPFENTPHDPGYIKGYVPGVRENGGQYTHAALWVVRALAELGRCDRAARLLAMLSPVSHAVTAEQAERYKVEPYVIAADVYGTPPHVGRGGWTWYTGSAGWMLRVTLETLLGFRLSDGDTLVLRPRIPDEWPGFTLRWRVPGEATRYEIVAANPRRCARGVTSARADGAPVPIEGAAAHVPLARDGRAHRVDLELG
jgi:cyclic beta-1,2-glucan synthetase